MTFYSNKQNKIYDCFTFFNELELLEIRLNVLNDYVDKFVLVEATKTQNNQDKILYYDLNKDKFKSFSDKIIHIVVDDYPKVLKQWTIENHQRNAICRGLINCQDDDIIMISDLDEIPRPDYIKKYYDKNKIIALDMDVFNFYLNNYSVKQDWTHGTKILSYKNFKNILDDENSQNNSCIDYDINIKTTPSKIRLYYGEKQHHIAHGGWHFSYIGKENTIQKVRSTCEGNSGFDEKSYNVLIKSNKFIKFKLLLVVIDDFFPEYIQINKDKYKNLIKHSKCRKIKPIIKYIDLIEVFKRKLGNFIKNKVLKLKKATKQY